MDRARRAEPYSNATIWTREIAKNLAGHLDRLSKVHSCIDTSSPKSINLPKFQHKHAIKKQNLVHSPKPVDDVVTNQEEAEARNERASASRKSHKSRSVSKRTQMELERQEAIAAENERLQQRIHKIAQHHPTPSATSSAGSAPPSSSSFEANAKTRGSQHDYNKKQQQLKIWQENQALLKRLRSAKPTLNAKEWEKDDKWNQNFLKTQERRRLALQHEMQRELQRVVQNSPLQSAATTAVQRIRTQGLDSPTTSADSRVSAVRQVTSAGKKRKPLGKFGPSAADADVLAHTAPVNQKRLVALEQRPSTDAMDENALPLTAAANHRRILLLRQRKAESAVVSRSGARLTTEKTKTRKEKKPPTQDYDDHELVSVRFTFSREGRRPVQELSDESFATMTPLSPAAEIEGVLETMLAMETRTTEEEQAIQLHVFEALQACIDEVARLQEAESSASVTMGATETTDKPCGAVDHEAGIPTTEIPTEADDDEDHGYDVDGFEANSPINKHTKDPLEESGCYGSEFEDGSIDYSHTDHELLQPMTLLPEEDSHDANRYEEDSYAADDDHHE